MRRSKWVWFVPFGLIIGNWTVRAEEQQVQIDEVLCGANGDSTVQFIELKFDGLDQNRWGPQDGETEGRARLLFFDATGAETGEFVFPSDPAVGPVDPVNGGISVLIATTGFANLDGAPEPGFVIAPSLLADSAKVCFTGNPDNPNAVEANLCLSYGNFVGDTEQDTLGQPAGAPAAAMPITDAVSLQRNQNYQNYGTGQFNADFALAVPAPRNSAGAVGVIEVAPTITQGETLFMKESFLGNGRSCSTCHRAEDHFGLSPTLIATLPDDDPLFVAEFNPDLAELEDPCLMRSERALILENIDGFGNPHVFRTSPGLANLSLTSPYGLSGEIETLQDFATGAVRQHLPRTLNRNSDPTAGPVDFRLPTDDELAFMEEFMESISVPADGNFDIDRMIDAAVARGGDGAKIEAGRTVFFGSGKCFMCHGGPVLAEADVTLGGGNQSFDTGVVDANANDSVDCLDGPLPPEAGGNRKFNIPQLLGTAKTGPFFHDGSAKDLEEVINFYRTGEFFFSPGGQAVGGIFLFGSQDEELEAFLEALIEPIRVHNRTQGSEHFTIQTAIEEAVDGDVIEADPGLFLENVDFLGLDIVVRSADPLDPDVVAATIIDGGDDGPCVQLSAGQLSGFTIQNGASASEISAGVHASGTAVVSHNVITGNAGAGPGPGGVSALDSAIVRNNVIKANAAAQLSGGVEASGSAQVINNVVAENSADLAGAILARDNALIRHNTIVDTSTDGGAAAVQGEDNAVLTHNVIAFSTLGGGLQTDGGAVVADYNCVFGNEATDYSNPEAQGPHDVNTNPLLAADHAHLTSASPCVDAGDPAFVAPTDEIDFDGGPRLAGTAVDLGADERSDCNANDVDDFLDVSGGASDDCDGNIVPDECQSDCNGNGTADPCDIASGQSLDCQLNGVPDGCETDSDGDGSIDDCDPCPNDVNKTDPGVCGCGIADDDTDGDGTLDCNDPCPDDPNKTDPGLCGCGISDNDADGDGTPDCNDLCIDDPNKTEPGLCGCGVVDDETDTDGDGTADCNDLCPSDPDKTDPGLCGCGVPDDGTDSDGDGASDCIDPCPDDPNKIDPGACGCGVADDDADGDGTLDCNDLCPDDPDKTDPGLCGCGAVDDETDTDGDGTPDCNDLCPDDPEKTEPGLCGCGVVDDGTDSDGDGASDCNDPCPDDPTKTDPGACGCGVADDDSDGDGTPNCNDPCPDDPDKTDSGACGCGVADDDADGDGTPDCNDLCPADADKIEPGVCGCGLADDDADSDGTPDCNDLCPTDPNKTDPGLCGCDVADDDTDGDGTPDCQEVSCPGDVNGDGTVDPLDSGYVLARLACSVGTGDPDCDAADANLDGVVDPLDVGFVLSRFGDCP